MQKLQIIGERYRLLEKIGEGGMAVIYLALDEKLGRKVAIKILHEHLCENQDIRNRFQLEAQAISSLDHPNIVKIYDFSGNYSRQLWIVTEVIRGQNLSEYCDSFAQKRLHPALASLMIRELCKALQAAHQSGIVHRDIKPENIMFTHFGDIKLMDFGIAKDIHNISSTQTGTFMGSPSYMSPEQVRGKDIDHRTDLYSVGVVFFELITGRIPFVGNTMHEVVVKIMEGKYTPPHMLVPNIPIEISVIIQKCLERDLDKRFASSDILAQEIDKLLLKHFQIEDSQIELQRFMKDRYAFFKKLNSFANPVIPAQEVAKPIDPVTVQIQNHNDAAFQAPPQVTRITPPPPLQRFRENSLASLRNPLIGNGTPSQPIPSASAPRRDRLIPSSRLPKSLSKVKDRKQKLNKSPQHSPFVKEARYAPRARSYVSEQIPLAWISESISKNMAVWISWIVLILILIFSTLQSKKILDQYQGKVSKTNSTTNRAQTTPNPVIEDKNQISGANSDLEISPSSVRITEKKQSKVTSSNTNNIQTGKSDAEKNIPGIKKSESQKLVEIPSTKPDNKNKNTSTTQDNSEKQITTKSWLKISSIPAAEIFKDNQRLGTTNELGQSSKWMELSSGRHELVLKRQGFSDYWVQLNLNANEKRTLQDLKLSPISTSTIKIISQEVPFNLKIENLSRKLILNKRINTSEHQEALPPDTYAIEISSKTNFLRRRVQITSTRQTMVIEFNPKKASTKNSEKIPDEVRP